MKDKISFQDFVTTRYENIPAIAINIPKAKKEYKKYLEGTE